VKLSQASKKQLRDLLCELGIYIREAVCKSRSLGISKLSRISAITASDTIFAIDRVSEKAIFAWFEKSWPKKWPVQLVMEGIDEEEKVVFPRGATLAQTVFKCILDPIDGTRGLMYDKRSAWILSGIALQRGDATQLQDICIAVMTEIPTTRQWRSDQISAIKGQGIKARCFDTRSKAKHNAGRVLNLKASRAKSCINGFASFARFFPQGKAITSRIEESLWRNVYGEEAFSGSTIFEDQYISTGGQLYELLCGHDRAVFDIRPLVFTKIRASESLVCHPYDICTQLILLEADAVIEHPMGGGIKVPLDTTTAVAWVGYANKSIARKLRAPLRRALRKELKLK